MASAIPALMSAARYRTVVAARVLGADDPDEAARVLRKHRNTHAVLLGAMLGASRSTTPSQQDAGSGSLLDVFESTKTSLSDAGQLILATTLLYLAHETDESSRVNATELGQAEWSRVLDEEAWNATFDRLGAFFCLALAPELGHSDESISDRLAWEAWRAGAVMWPRVENARRRLQVVDRSFQVVEPEPVLLDYLDAVSAEELVQWITDDDALDTFTSVGAES